MGLSWWPIPSFPKLASNNYNGWSIQMKTFLKNQEVWDAIEVVYGVMLAAAVTVKAQREARVRDKKALSFLHQGIDEANFDKIIEVKNAKIAWEFLKKAHQSADERRREEEKRSFDSAKAERVTVEKAQAEARERAERAAVLREQEDENEENDEDEKESDEDDEDEELDQGLQSSADEARNFEELHKHSSSFVDSEAKRALELKRLLEETKVSAKEMED
ncbi:hypothetical protein Droror1_Dr00024107 [Drosera rotundifolia]